MARPKTAVVCNSKQDDDGFCLDDLSTFGPEAVAVLEEEKKTAQANRKDAEKRLTRVFPLPVAALAARCLVADPGKLTDAEKELASNFVSLRRVREEWESDLVVFYEWWRRGREFCDDLLSLAKRIEWAKFASLASRVLFEEDHDGRSKLDFCLQLRHLQKVRQNLEQLLPLTSLDNEDSYQFDANGLLQRSPVGLRGKLQQKELALEIRPSEIHISQVINRQFTEAVVNLLLQHLTEQTRARTFFRKATKKKKDISGIFTANDIETSYFDSTVMPFRSRGWWYVAVKPDIRHGWIVILLSSEAPKPPSWPKETKLLGLPDTVHDKPNSNFLVYPCLQALSFDLPRFCDALRQRQMCCSTDVPTAAAEAKDIVEAAVLRSRGEKASVEHDTVAKETQEAAETLAGLGMLTHLSIFSFLVQRHLSSSLRLSELPIFEAECIRFRQHPGRRDSR